MGATVLVIGLGDLGTRVFDALARLPEVERFEGDVPGPACELGDERGLPRPCPPALLVAAGADEALDLRQPREGVEDARAEVAEADHEHGRAHGASLRRRLRRRHQDARVSRASV